METAFVVVIILVFVGLRVFLGYLIAGAAVRRGCGYLGWLISSLLFGPLIVWIIYLIFVHWRPTNFGIPYQEGEDTLEPEDVNLPTVSQAPTDQP